MRKAQQGVAFIIVLLIINLLSLLIFTQMDFLFLYQKAMNQQKKSQMNFYRLEAAAEKIAQATFQSYCLTKEQGANAIIAEISNRRCEYDGFPYVVEELGAFPCLQIKRGEESYSTLHYRITMLENSAVRSEFSTKRQVNQSKEQVFLQLRIAKPVPLRFCLPQEIFFITNSLLSWRLFTA